LTGRKQGSEDEEATEREVTAMVAHSTPALFLAMAGGDGDGGDGDGGGGDGGGGDGDGSGNGDGGEGEGGGGGDGGEGGGEGEGEGGIAASSTRRWSGIADRERPESSAAVKDEARG